MIKNGVATGNEVQEIFEHAKQNKYALPAVNVVNTSSVNAVLESARDNKSPAMIQFSAGGCQFFAGKGLSNDKYQSAIAGGISGAELQTTGVRSSSRAWRSRSTTPAC